MLIGKQAVWRRIGSCITGPPLCVGSVIETLGGKHRVMEKMLSEDPNVRLCALLTVQKIMVHNWSVVAGHTIRGSQPSYRIADFTVP